MRRRKIPETEYRSSRVCRVLGNPTAYKIIKILTRGPKTPSELAGRLGISVQTASDTLSKLRNIDLVRYVVKVNERTYWLKHPSIAKICKELENLVRRIRIQKW